MREEERRRDVRRELAQVAVVPGRLDALVQARQPSQLGVPADTKAVAVRRCRSLAGVQALVDQRVLSPEDEGLDRNWVTVVGKPTAHGILPSVGTRLPRRGAELDDVGRRSVQMLAPVGEKVF